MSSENDERKVAVAARMWWRAVLLALLTAMLVDGDKLQVGQSMDIMSRYGYLGITMKVVARNESDADWIFREPTYDVFADLDSFTVHPRRSARKGGFEGEFHMEFCDNLSQLMQAYFRDFEFEGLDKPWLAFTTGWNSPETIARHMGINSSFVHRGDYCYVLVRLSRFWDTVKLSKLPNNVNLLDSMAQEIDSIFVGDVASVLMFTKRVGTHYINSFITGNSLYQVFVYKKPVYLRIRERLKTRGFSNLSPVELSNFFSPWYAEHMGQIQVASGNKTVQNWAANKLRVHHYIFTYPTLLKIHGDPKLLGELNNLLQNEALLQLQLRRLTPVFKDPVKREWFNEILDNYLNLLEANS